MPYNFDANHYKKIFDQMYGNGQFDAGLQRAQALGRQNAQVALAKQAYNQRHFSSGVNKGVEKKSYQDAVDYIRNNKAQFLDIGNDPKHPKPTGAYQIANEIRNDPAKQAAIKAQGYNVTDYINALYAGLSDGNYRSEREYKQNVSHMNKVNADKIKAYKDKHGGLTQDQVYAMQKKAQEKKQATKGNEGWFGKTIDTIEKPLHGFMNTFNEAVKQGKENAKHYKYGQQPSQPLSKIAKDFKTGMNTQTSGAYVLNTMGVKNSFAKNAIGSSMDLFMDPVNLIGLGAVSKGAKLLNVAGKVEKGTKALGAGDKLAKLAGISAKGGTITGGASAIQQTADALAHPGTQSLKQRLENVGFNTAIGAIGDPLLHGLTGGFKAPKDIPPPNVTKTEVGATSENALNKLKQNAVPEQIQNMKDINTLQKGSNSLYQISDKLPKVYGDRIKTKLDFVKKSNIDFQQKLTSDLFNKVVKGLGIKNGSKESKLVQDFGEKTLAKKYLDKQGVDPSTVSPQELDKINLDELKRLAPQKWQDIVKARDYFKNAYDMLLYRVNQTRAKIYPGQADKIVPRREDYFHHFNDLTGLDSAKNLFETPANIDPKLEGISPFLKPKSKFQGFMQHRGLGPYKSDAVGGYLKYLKAASHSINVDPIIPVIRDVAKELADASQNTGHINNLIATLTNLANDFAGKTNPYDRLLQDYVLGRKGMKVVNWVNSRVKSNMILGNLSSALGQLGNIPLSIGKAKGYSFKGLQNTLTQTAKALIKGEKDAPIYKSPFLKERFGDKMYRQFDQKLLQQPKKLAIWMLETADKAGTHFTWNAMYEKAVKEGIKDPIKFADTETRKIVAGRGIGEVPLAQKSKTVQILAPFTLEVGNQWRVLKDMVGEKDAKGIITFLVAAYSLNKVTEAVRGSGVAYDPLDAIIDGYNKTDGNTLNKLAGALGSLAGETIGNIPGGNLITNMANTDKKIPLTDVKYKDLFAGRDPNRFGTGLTISKPLSDPLYALLPFGASQAEKTKQGLDAIKNQGWYKGGTLRTPIKTTPLKDAQLLAFGQYAPKEVQQYFEQNKRPLSKKQTELFNKLKKSNLQNEYYDYLSKLRKANKNK